MQCTGHSSQRSRGAALEQVEMPGNRARFRATAHAQFAIDTAHLGFNGIVRHDQLLGNLSIGSPGDEQLKNTMFLRTQWLERSLKSGDMFLHRSCAVNRLRSIP